MHINNFFVFKKLFLTSAYQNDILNFNKKYNFYFLKI